MESGQERLNFFGQTTILGKKLASLESPRIIFTNNIIAKMLRVQFMGLDVLKMRVLESFSFKHVGGIGYFAVAAAHHFTASNI